jgi:hypothetical protein
VADLSRDQLHRLARLGAQARLAELRAEEAAIRAAFPDLFGKRGARAPKGDGAVKTKRSGGKWSAASRKAVSERMKKYWSERRKAEK